MERRDEITPANARELAQRVAQRLETAFADQDARLTVNGHDVRCEVACPSPAVDNGLWISWEGPETDVIVGFHTQHSHFGPWEEYHEQETRIEAILAALDEGIATAREFIAERQVVISWHSNGEVDSATRDVPERALTTARQGAKDQLRFR